MPRPLELQAGQQFNVAKQGQEPFYLTVAEEPLPYWSEGQVFIVTEEMAFRLTIAEAMNLEVKE